MLRRLPLVNRLPAHLGNGVIGFGLAILAVHAIFVVTVWLGRSELFAEIYRDWLALSLAALERGAFWTPLSYALLHDLADPMHIAANLLGLYFFGPPAERALGQARFLRLVVGTVLGGAAASLALRWLGVDPQSVSVGASAAIMGLLGVFSWCYPDATVLLFFVVPLRSRYLVVIAVLLDLVVWWATSGRIDVAAHLGGLLVAWLMVKGYTRPRHVLARWRLWRSGGRRYRVVDGGRGGPTIN
jgi:membrane associated rhomboid family serine protease